MLGSDDFLLGNFKIKKNALAQFFPNHPPKYMITSTNYLNNCSSFDAFKPKLISGASVLKKYVSRNWGWSHLLFYLKF